MLLLEEVIANLESTLTSPRDDIRVLLPYCNELQLRRLHLTTTHQGLRVAPYNQQREQQSKDIARAEATERRAAERARQAAESPATESPAAHQTETVPADLPLPVTAAEHDKLPLPKPVKQDPRDALPLPPIMVAVATANIGREWSEQNLRSDLISERHNLAQATKHDLTGRITLSCRRILILAYALQINELLECGENAADILKTLSPNGQLRQQVTM